MEKNVSRIRIFVLIFGILFLIIFFKNQIQTILSSKPKTPFSLIKKEAINRAEIMSEATTSALIKKNDRWYVRYGQNEYEADQTRINELIDNLISLKKEEIVSKNKKKHKEFGIDKQKIRFYAKDQWYVLFIGNSNGTSRSYGRVNDENEVFLITGIDSAFYPNDYRDLIVPIVSKRDKVENIQIIFDDQNLILEKIKDEWKIGKKSARQEQIDILMNDLVTLRATNILFDGELPETKSLTIRIRENKQEKEIDFYQQDSENYLVNVKGSKKIYQVSTSLVDAVKRGEKDF